MEVFFKLLIILAVVICFVFVFTQFSQNANEGYYTVFVFSDGQLVAQHDLVQNLKHIDGGWTFTWNQRKVMVTGGDIVIEEYLQTVPMPATQPSQPTE